MGSERSNANSDIYLTGDGAMLNSSPWGCIAKDRSSASDNTGTDKDVHNITPGDSKMSNHGFNSSHIDVAENDFCTASPFLGDNSAATHDNLYNYSLNNISQTENDLSFLDNEGNDKENDDMFYGWSDIGDFEDMDKILRSCDSTFGLDNFDNEDDFWFSSSQPMEESEAARIDDYNPNTMSENHEASVQKNEGSLANNSSNHVVSDSAPWKVSADASALHSQKRDVYTVDEQKKQAKHLHHLDGKRKRNSENGINLHQSDKSSQMPSEVQQSGVTYSHLNNDQPSYQSSMCQLNSENNNPYPGSASNESYVSNQGQGQDMDPSLAGKRPNMTVNSESTPNQDRKVGGVLDSSNLQDSSNGSSVMDDVSLEATNFRQLRRVIEQLDIRTKMCIRDSLYRLAKSAEQRHNCLNPTSGNRQENDAMTDQTNKFAGFMDLETNTNPIDRSIAHLLFHRPSDSTPASDNTILSYRSYTMIIPQPNPSPSLRIEKQKETSAVSVAGRETETN